MTAMMALSGGDVISLSLPQFTSSNTSSVLLDLEGRSAGVFNASMAQWNETAQVLLLRVAGSAGHVRVGAEHSITIRVLGLSFRGDFASVAGQGITISTVAAAGNVLQTNVSRACRSLPAPSNPPTPSPTTRVPTPILVSDPDGSWEFRQGTGGMCRQTSTVL